MITHDMTQAQRAHALPHSLPASVTIDDVRYTGYLFPETAKIVTMSEEAFYALMAQAKGSEADVVSGAEYRERYAE